MTAQEIRDKIYLLKHYYNKNGERKMEMIPRCAVCKMIMIINEQGEYVCVNSDIHNSNKQYIEEGDFQ